MGHVAGYAFTTAADTESKARQDRYKELGAMPIKPIHVDSSSPQYGRNVHAGRVFADNISDLDILIWCDRGNTCFGGTVLRGTNGNFQAIVYTD